MEDLSDASYLGKLPKVRLDWKVFARHKHSRLLGLVISDEGKKFYNIDTWPLIMRLNMAPFKAVLRNCSK